MTPSGPESRAALQEIHQKQNTNRNSSNPTSSSSSKPNNLSKSGQQPTAALSKLRAQALKRAEQRIHSHGPEAGNMQTSRGSRIAAPEPHQLAQQEPKAACRPQAMCGPVVARRLTTTVVKGLQPCPPTASAASVNAQASRYPAPASWATARPMRIIGNDLVAAQQQQQQQQQSMKGHPQATLLAVHGIGLLAHLPAAASQQQHRLVLVSRACPGAADTSLLGCCLPWQQLKANATVVRQKSRLFSKQEQEHHRLMLAQLVVQQWRWFVIQQRRWHRAVHHWRKKLLLLGWMGLQQEAQHQQLLQCQAKLLASKNSFLLLSCCFGCWHQQLQQQQHEKALLAAWDARHRTAALQGTLHSWRLLVREQRCQEQMLLRAEAHYMLNCMARVLQCWTAWLRDQQVMRLKASRATSHWREVGQRRLLCAWQLRVEDTNDKWQQLAKALSFHKQKHLTKAVHAWEAAVAQQQQGRERLVLLLTQWQQRQQLQAIRLAVCCWHAVARQQILLRQLQQQLIVALQLQRKHQVLLHWSQLLRYHKQLGIAASRLHGVGNRWWLLYCWQHWKCLVEVMQGQRGDELQQLVQLRACIGTWLKFTEQQGHRQCQLAAARKVLCLVKLQLVLPAWLLAAEQLKHQRLQTILAQMHFRRRHTGYWLKQWQANAAQASSERMQLEAAAEMHSRRLAMHTLHAWIRFCWYCDLKQRALSWHMKQLQLKAMHHWCQYSLQKKVLQQCVWQAQQHCQRRALTKAWAVWWAAVQRAVLKQQMLQKAWQHCRRQQLLRALQAWRGPFLQLQHMKQAQQLLAAKHQQQSLCKRAYAAWRAAVQAGRAQQQQLALANHHWQQRLLHSYMQPWKLELRQAQQERQELAAAAAPAEQALAAGRQHRVLGSWWQLVVQLRMDRTLASKATCFRQHVLLLQGLQSWRQYLLRRRQHAAATECARRHRRTVLSSAVLHILQGAVSTAHAKRSLLVSAALLRRSWLMTRGYRAWRLAAAMASMERAAATCPQPAALQALSSTTAPHIQQQQQMVCLDAIAAAVVAATCASHTHWQQRWRKQWHMPLDTHQPDQLHKGGTAAVTSSTSTVNQGPPPELIDCQRHCQHSQQTGVSAIDSQQQEEPVVSAACQPRQQCVDPAAVTPTGAIKPQTMSVSSSRARRPPRVPLFMHTEMQLPLHVHAEKQQLQHGQQQQQQQCQPQVSSQSMQQLATTHQEHPLQLEQQVSTAEAARPGDSVGSPAAAGAAVAAGPCWTQPPGARKTRPQPRQLGPAIMHRSFEWQPAVAGEAVGPPGAAQQLLLAGLHTAGVSLLSTAHAQASRVPLHVQAPCHHQQRPACSAAVDS